MLHAASNSNSKHDCLSGSNKLSQVSIKLKRGTQINRLY